MATHDKPQGTGRRFVFFKIWRQQSPDHEGRFDECKMPYNKGATVMPCLMELQRTP